MITEKTHPFRHNIIGRPREQLLIRKGFVDSALRHWKENRYKAPPDRQEYNVNYFNSELNIINKELEKRKNKN